MNTNVQFFCNNQVIQGKIFPAATRPSRYPTVLLLPGFPGSEDDVLDLGGRLSSAGVNVATFNYRGTHRSEGEYGLTNTLEDIAAAFQFLQDEQTAAEFQIDPARIVLGGWSYGGGMGLIYAANHPEVKHVFSIAGTDHGEFAREYQRNETFANMMDTIFEGLKYPDGPVKFSGKQAIKAGLIDNSDPYDALLHAARLVERDVLLIGGWDDANVTVEGHILPVYRQLKELGAKEVSIVVLQDDHFFAESRAELAQVILNWLASISAS